MIVDEDWGYCGMGAGIADKIQKRVFDDLDAPIRRVAGKDAPIPYAGSLESLDAAERGADLARRQGRDVPD